MRRVLLAATILAALGVAPGAKAQTAADLQRGAADTKNVLNYGMGYNLQRFSPLRQIDKQSVKRLVPVFNYSYDDNRAAQSQPLVYNGVIYVTSHAATMAVDAKTGKQLWKTKVEYPPETPRIVCCGIINRGAALFDGKLFRTTLDAHVIALDAKTGKELWRSKAEDFKTGHSFTVAPLVADGVVITGISGAEYGIRGFIDGWDPATGKHLWRTYTVAGPGDANASTWPGDTWERGGGSAWITGSYDPEQNTVFWGTGNAGSWNSNTRPGDNLYTCSVLALDPKTGKIKWHFQFSPNDFYDYDSVAEMVLADINVNGQPTKALMNANRNGFFYVLDRTNGKLLTANAYGKQINWAEGIDMKTGRPIDSEVTKHVRATEQTVEVWPSVLGNKNWSPVSFNPNTGLVYANTLNIGMKYTPTRETYRAGATYWGAEIEWVFPQGARGQLSAIDPLTGKAKWEAPSDIPRFSGVLSTAGGVVFTGKLTGEFEAFDADTGEKLWQFQAGSGIEGMPVTWEQDGTQYVAVSVGIGGVYSIHSGDERMANVPAGSSLWVFALPK
ncbi:methanol/ethanol family PQQ-dependent dehydrogenase [Paracraurococcus lichenis]|uniref:Methanol/ethanol family PQQ-dependent dehydrogenase n=1 Tax=Paracraurococcus lichenis TaxID=3064888 RepID=A0ABT9DZ58_9PROT|nr:methanol/ethanol family PQQ-dependent dehydrogenase [Paracraurococcus sp. LOR1-02]MDO9709202.1 methanol/ethanol family PQQ-dependent dehydrogenase [Paracraurococcus sp. LOR1-02]